MTDIEIRAIPHNGKPRGIEPQAKIWVLRFESAASEVGRGYDGYWESLGYKGRRSYDALNMLKRHIKPEIYYTLLGIMCEEDGYSIPESEKEEYMKYHSTFGQADNA